MPVALEVKLQGKETQVIHSVRETGPEATMVQYGIKTKATFKRWLTERGEAWPDDSPLARIHGGEKHMFLKLKADSIRDCVAILGKGPVKTMFCVNSTTLDAILEEEAEEGDLKAEIRRLRRDNFETHQLLEKVRLDLDILQEQRAEETRAVKQLCQGQASFQLLIGQQVTEGIRQMLGGGISAFLQDTHTKAIPSSSQP